MNKIPGHDRQLLQYFIEMFLFVRN